MDKSPAIVKIVSVRWGRIGFEKLIRVAARFLAGFPIPTSLASAARIFFFCPRHFLEAGNLF
jgi:hypothetical protein